MKISIRILFILMVSATVFMSAESQAFGCGRSPDKSQTVAVSLSTGGVADLDISYFAGSEDGTNAASCNAVAFVRLSRFPTSRLAVRPSEFAAAIRDAAYAWKISECTITVVYENDTTEEVAQHEQCVTGSFKYDKGDYWSSSSEANCWEPG